jgi:hypothetical protein
MKRVWRALLRGEGFFEAVKKVQVLTRNLTAFKAEKKDWIRI